MVAHRYPFTIHVKEMQPPSELAIYGPKENSWGYMGRIGLVNLGCPYRSSKEWLEMKKDPELWADAIEVDEAIRHGFKNSDKDNTYYLHSSCQPLRDVKFEELDTSHEISYLDEYSGLCAN